MDGDIFVASEITRKYPVRFSTYLKNRPIPSTLTRSFLRRFRSHSLLWAAKANAPLPTTSQKPLLWNIPFFAACPDTSELLSRKWCFLQQSGKLLLKEVTGRSKLHHSVRDPLAIFVFLVDFSIFLVEVCRDVTSSPGFFLPRRQESGKLFPGSLPHWPLKSKMAASDRMNARGWPRNRSASNAGKYMSGPQGTQIDRTVRL